MHASIPKALTRSAAQLDVMDAFYWFTLLACSFMAIWSAVFPGHWMASATQDKGAASSQTRLNLHARVLASLPIDYMPVTHEVVLRFVRFPSVRFLHVLPSALWSALAPLLLASQTGRVKLPAGRHKLLGRLMLTSSASIILGYAAMVHHQVGIPPDALGKYGLHVLIAWFACTAVLALVSARRKRFAAHRRWVVRHIGSGAWVIVQRWLVAAAWLPARLGVLTFNTPQEKERGFYACAQIGIALTLLGTEYCVAWLPSTVTGVNQSPAGTKTKDVQASCLLLAHGGSHQEGTAKAKDQ